MHKAKTSGNPVLQWMLKLSENELNVLDGVVGNWTNGNAAQVTQQELQQVVKGLHNISTQITTADEYNLVLPHLPLVGRILMKLIGLPMVMDSNVDLHRNLLLCLINLNRTKPNANSARMKARAWALKAIRQLCTAKHDVTAYRQAGMTNSDMVNEMRRNVFKRFHRELSEKDASRDPDTERKCLELVQKIVEQKEYRTRECFDDVLSCIEVLSSSPLKVELIDSIATFCFSQEMDFKPNHTALRKLWGLHKPSFEKASLKVVENCTESDLEPERIMDILCQSTVIQVASEDSELMKVLMNVVAKLIPFNASRFTWLPTFILRVSLRRNPGIDFTYFPPVLQPLLVFFNLPSDGAFSTPIIDLIYRCIETYLMCCETKTLKLWYKDWYLRCLLSILEKGTRSNLLVGLWMNGHSLIEERFTDDLSTFARVLESRNSRIIAKFLEEQSNALDPIMNFIEDLVVAFLLQNQRCSDDPLRSWVEKSQRSQFVDEWKECVRMLKPLF